MLLFLNKNLIFKNLYTILEYQNKGGNSMDIIDLEKSINVLFGNRTMSTHRIVWSVYTAINPIIKYTIFNNNFYSINCIDLKNVNVTYLVNLTLYPVSYSSPAILFLITGTIIGSTANKKYLKLSNVKIQFI